MGDGARALPKLDPRPGMRSARALLLPLLVLSALLAQSVLAMRPGAGVGLCAFVVVPPTGCGHCDCGKSACCAQPSSRDPSRAPLAPARSFVVEDILPAPAPPTIVLLPPPVSELVPPWNDPLLRAPPSVPAFLKGGGLLF